MSWRLLIYMISLLLTHFQWKQISGSLSLLVPPQYLLASAAFIYCWGKCKWFHFQTVLENNDSQESAPQVALQLTVNFLSICTANWACSWRTPPVPSGETLCVSPYLCSHYRVADDITEWSETQKWGETLQKHITLALQWRFSETCNSPCAPGVKSGNFSV